MCGIAGFVGVREEKHLHDMVNSIRHRGPDNIGFLLRGDVGLGHARLSIIDTSSGAHQPMFSANRQCALVFNGEIYNFLLLRRELEARGYQFKTTSDSEVILALYAQEGIKAFKRLTGMFAIALYDFSEQTLILVRDRLGEKPLYWSFQNGIFVFASELKGIMESGLIKKEVDMHSLNAYLQFDYVPTPRSMLSGVYKLEPATILCFKKGAVTKERFWYPPPQLLHLNEVNAIEQLDCILHETVSRELVSDVPLGVFLSGGIDSSAIAYYAQRESTQPIDTFSIGFDEPSFDESKFAQTVATHLGTHHHEHTIHAKDALELVPKLGDILCEPVADASIIPTLLLSQFARQSVTVALGGDGGDELFAGYPTFQADTPYSWYATLPVPVRHIVRRAIETLPASHNNFSFSYELKKLVSSDEPDTVRRHLGWLGSFGAISRSKIAGPTLLSVADSANVFEDIESSLQDFTQQDVHNRLLFAYARSYLMDQVLVKVDRASMYHSLETRSPLLNHAVVDFMFSLPYSLKYRNGTTKYLLKKTLKGKLPEHIINRKKKGFGIPLAQWLSGPLRSLSEDLLSKNALSTHGFFNEIEIKRLQSEHMSGHRDNRKELWNLMVFQLWYNRWIK